MMDKQHLVLDILTRSGFKPRLSSSQNIAIPCPLAPYTPLHKGNRDGSPSMGIKVTEGRVLVNCFTCGFKSGQLSFLYSRLSKHDHSWSEAFQFVREFETKCMLEGLSSLSYKRKTVEDLQPLDETLYTPFSRKLAPYFVRRGISLDSARRWDLGVDLEKKRALIPVRDQRGRLWGAVGRSYVNERPKYLNYWNFKKGLHLVGAQLIKEPRKTVIVEGSLDAILTDQALFSSGEYNVVSVLGASVSQQQVQQITAMSLEVILAFDNDDAGHQGSLNARASLSKRLMTRTTHAGLVGKKDFGECSPEEIVHCINSATL